MYDYELHNNASGEVFELGSKFTNACMFYQTHNIFTFTAINSDI